MKKSNLVAFIVFMKIACQMAVFFTVIYLAVNHSLWWLFLFLVLA